VTGSTRGLATVTFGGGGGAVACFSSQAASAAVRAQARSAERRRDAGLLARTRFKRSSCHSDPAHVLFTRSHQSGGGTGCLSKPSFEDGNPGASGRSSTESAPPEPQLVRPAICSRVVSGAKSESSLICQPPPSAR